MFEVINNIHELTIKVNKPRVKIFNGRVNSNKIGRINKFNKDKIKLANKAVKKLSTTNKFGKKTVIPIKVSMVTTIFPKYDIKSHSNHLRYQFFQHLFVDDY